MGGVALIVATVFSLLSFIPHNPNDVILKAESASYVLQVANTPAERALGLGVRASLPSDQGMLFVFGQSAVQCFWMKDMHFPLDMIWLSTNKQVEYIQSDVSPNTYPHTFCPHMSAKFVIELNAGQVERAHIRTGETLSF